MQTDTSITKTDPATAVKLIGRWKNDASIRAKYSSAAAYFIEAEWQADSDLRAEFGGDYESYAAFSRRAG